MLIVHIICTIVFYLFIQKNGGDANTYWYVSDLFTTDKSLSELLLGSGLIKLFNYPFAIVLGLPQYVGFAIYSSIGFVGICLLYKLFILACPDGFYAFGINIIQLFFLLPNLHFWTSGITKEALVFTCMAYLFLFFFKKRYSWLFAISWILLGAIRPHLALLLLVGFGVAVLLDSSLSRKHKSYYILAITGLCAILLAFVLRILKFNPLNIGRWMITNSYSRQSFMGSTTYIDMENTNMLFQLYSFHLAPLFHDIVHPYIWIISMENMMMSFIFLLMVLRLVGNYKNLKFSFLTTWILSFFVVGTIAFMLRYSGLGIFLRTRMLLLPFLVLALLMMLDAGKDARKDRFVKIS
ncbi:hypothetical protein SAMN05192588_0374 [Nonlabens sp. Hel1_33_55]|nr:hypothetical protein SAMN05192588_0374 [Nonlabens sp. Hel1_33_55]